MKKLHILYIAFAIMALFFIGKTIKNTTLRKELNCVERINYLNNQLEEKQKIIDSLQINNWLFEDYYCSAENLFDTIFYHMITDGIFVFEYEPYTQVSNNIFEYEELYNFLEEKRKKL